MKPLAWVGWILGVGFILYAVACGYWGEAAVDRALLRALKYTLWGVVGIILVIGCFAYPLGLLVGIGAWYVIEMHDKLERIAKAAERKDK
jgi:multisubunit Na+/H+ antiporter MnhB subunit